MLYVIAGLIVIAIVPWMRNTFIVLVTGAAALSGLGLVIGIAIGIIWLAADQIRSMGWDPMKVAMCIALPPFAVWYFRNAWQDEKEAWKAARIKHAKRRADRRDW